MLVKEQSRLLSLIESGFAALRVLVIGDVMLDRSIWGDVDRISPEAPVPVLRSVRTSSAPGGAANVAMNLVGLGVKVAQAGFWGNDGEMRELSALLAPAGVDFSGMIVSGHSTISKTRIVSRNQQLLRLDVESSEPPSGRRPPGIAPTVAGIGAGGRRRDSLRLRQGRVECATLPGGHCPGSGAKDPGAGRSQGPGLRQVRRRHYHLP